MYGGRISLVSTLGMSSTFQWSFPRGQKFARALHDQARRVRLTPDNRQFRCSARRHLETEGLCSL